MKLPRAPATMSAAVSAGGGFKHAELEIGPGVPPLPLLWATPPVTLAARCLGVRTAEGFKMAGKVGIVGGGEIAGTALVGVDGP